jgi:hypothetical protein
MIHARDVTANEAASVGPVPQSAAFGSAEKKARICRAF